MLSALSESYILFSKFELEYALQNIKEFDNLSILEILSK